MGSPNRGLIDGRPVISDTVAFDDADEAFKLAGDKSRAVEVQNSFVAESGLFFYFFRWSFA